MLHFARLRALHAVSAHGSINAAADALHVTTSAVSQQLAKLERDIERPLLEKNGRGVRLTETAKMLVSHTHQALSVLEQAEAALDDQRETVGGEITITAFATAARGLAPFAIRELRRRYPQLNVVFREQEPTDVMPLLLRRDVDLVLEGDWLNAPLALPEGLSKAALMDDVADVVLPPGHRFSRAKIVKLDDLGEEQWVCWNRSSICHDWLLQTLRSLGHDPHIVHTAEEHATQLALVAAGLGAAVIPRLGRGPLPKGVAAVPSEPALQRRIYAVWRTDATRRGAIRAAVEAFQMAARQIASPQQAAHDRRPGIQRRPGRPSNSTPTQQRPAPVGGTSNRRRRQG
jgi:molybdate transport repressor ModE-like protein